MITVVRGEKGLIGIYKDGELRATHDKFTWKSELETCIESLSGKDEKVTEMFGDFSTFADIPAVLKDVKKVKSLSKEEPAPKEREGIEGPQLNPQAEDEAA